MTEPVEIEGVVHGGHGLARLDGEVCFVPGALPEDVVRLGEVTRRRNVLWGVVETLESPSPHRWEPPCSCAAHATACTWIHFAYPAQAKWKQHIIGDCLSRIGGLQPELQWREDAQYRLGYRTRATFHGDGRAWGFFAPGTKRVMDRPSCALCHERLNHALGELRAVRMNGSVELTVNPGDGAILVWTRHPNASLRKVFPSVNHPRQKAPRNSFLFDGIPVIAGGFSQASLLLNRLLVSAVREIAGDAESILDLYCGSGNLSLPFADTAEVRGLDHNLAAITAAQRLGKGRYHIGDETAFQRALTEEQWDVVVLDPPRSGARPILNALAGCGARKMVYVSCDPATLARDLKHLTQHGWRLGRVLALDLFPHTPHVETVCELTPE